MNIFRSNNDLSFMNLIDYPEINIVENSFTFLVGESGCGKSTYLKMLNRTVLPEAGEIFYNDKKIDEYPVLSYRKEVLLAPQDVFLLDSSIEENFYFYYDAREEKRPTSSEMQHFLNLCCADFPLDYNCNTLSGGERQRVFLAIFLSCKPKVFLLDEPTAALDEATSIALLQNLKDYCKEANITVVCICHNNILTKQFADEIISLGGLT